MLEKFLANKWLTGLGITVLTGIGNAGVLVISDPQYFEDWSRLLKACIAFAVFNVFLYLKQSPLISKDDSTAPKE